MLARTEIPSLATLDCQTTKEEGFNKTNETWTSDRMEMHTVMEVVRKVVEKVHHLHSNANTDPIDAAKDESSVKIHKERTNDDMGDLQLAKCMKCGKPCNLEQHIAFCDHCDLQSAECEVRKLVRSLTRDTLLLRITNQLLMLRKQWHCDHEQDIPSCDDCKPDQHVLYERSRTNRTAAQRREQAGRASARFANLLLRLASLPHRGFAVGRCLALAAEEKAARVDAKTQTSSVGERSETLGGCLK